MKIVIFGGGGFGLEVLTYARDLLSANANTNGEDEIAGIIDEQTPRKEDFTNIDSALGFYRGPSDISGLENAAVIVAIGDPIARHKKMCEVLDLGLPLVSVIHASAYIAGTATIEDGAVIAPFAFVGPYARVRRNAVLNTYASVGHDGLVGESAVLSPYAVLNGAAQVGRAGFLGSGAAILPGGKLGNCGKLSSGSVLKGSTEPGALAHGNPAKWRVMFKEEV